jgi:hypothetical protein
MAKIIEAKAVISAEDKTGAVFDKVAKKLDGLAKSGKTAKAVDQVAKSLASVQKQIEAISSYQKAKTDFLPAQVKLRAAQAEAARVAAVMKTISAPDQRAMASEQRRVAQAVDQATKAYERQKSIVLGARHALTEMGIPIDKMVQHQDRLRQAVERTNAALERQPSRARTAAAAVGRGAGNILPFAGPAILHGAKEAVKGGAEIESERVRMRAAGIPEADIKRAFDESAELGVKYPNVKRADVLERFKELRSILLHPEEAHELLDPTIRAASAIKAVDRSGHMASGLGFAVKGAEVLGLAQDKKRFTAYLDSWIKAQQVMGATITPEQQYEFAKYLKASGAGLSDRFKMTTGVSLSQELGGSTTGVGIDQFIKQVIGGFQGSQHAAAKSFVKLGLADKNDFEQTKTGEIKGFKPGRHVKGYKLAQSDPDRWIYEYYLPALKKAGITSEEDINSQIRRDFPSGRAADIVAKIINQRQSFENHAKLYGKAQGLDAVATNQNDPFVALDSMTTSLGNLAATLTSPAMKDAAGVMSSIATGLGSWGESLHNWQKDHPDLARGAAVGAIGAGVAGGGVLTYSLFNGLMNGFGLKGSAAALDASAALLSEAALALNGGKVAGITNAAAGAAGGAAASGGRSALWRYGAGALPFLGTAGMIAAGVGATIWGMQSIPRLSENRNPRVGGGRKSAAAWPSISGSIGSDNAVSDWSGWQSSVSPGTGGKLVAQLTGSGEIHGTAKLEVTASSQLLQVVERAERSIALTGKWNTNGAGSTGRSSPDAMPGSTGARP